MECRIVTVTICGMITVSGLPQRYHIESPIGEGGFGKVYRVFDSQLARFLALKVISQESASIRSSLMKEFRVLSKLQHPNLVRVFDFGALESRIFYFTMEFIEGQNLRSYFRSRDNLHMLPSIIEQLLDALGYLHGSSIVHGDIKPDNIMITGDGAAKLLDFGLISSGDKQGNRMSGTARFLAPEILREGAGKSPATDLYALGATLIESIEDKDYPAILELSEAQTKERRAGVNQALLESGIKNPSSLASSILDLCDPDPQQRPASIALYYEDKRNMAFHPIFVGREKELDEIARFLRPSQTAKRALVLRGPRGVGKKSIIRKATQAEQLRKRLIIDLSSLPHDYFSPNELVRVIASQVDSSDAEKLLKKTATQSSRAASLQHVPETRSMGQRSLVLYNHIADGLKEIASRRSVTLNITDIDALGQEYLSFLNLIFNHLDLGDFDLKMILSFNSNVALTKETAGFAQRLSASQLVTFLDVEEFSSELLADYFARAFRDQLLSPHEREILLARTGGIPLVIDMATRHLISSGIIRLEAGKWIFDRALFAQSEPSYGGDKALELALMNLDPRERRLLELFAILNHEISAPTIERLAADLAPIWPSAKKNFLERAILVERPGGTLVLAHPQYAELILRRCEKKTAIELNRRIADYLAGIESPDSLRILHHYVAAEEIDNAMKAARDVIGKLYAPYMPFDCLKLFIRLSDAARRSGSPSQLLQVTAWLAPLEVQAGLLPEAMDAYSALIENEADPSCKAQYMIEQALIIDMNGNSEHAISSLRKAQNYVRAHKLNRLLAHTYFHLGHMVPRRRIPHYKKALALSKNVDRDMYLSAAVRLYERSYIRGDSKNINRYQGILTRHLHEASDEAKKDIFGLLARVHFTTGEYDLQRAYLEKKMDLEKKQDDMRGILRSLNSLAGHYYTTGDNEAFLSTLKQSYSLALRFNQATTAVTAGFNFVLAYRVLGDLGKALDAIAHTEKLAQERKCAYGPILRVPSTQIFVLLGNATHSELISRAKTLYREALSYGNPISLGHYHMCYSTYHLLNLRHKKALASAEKAIALFKKAQDRDDVTLAHIQKSILLVALGELKEATRNIRQATKIYDAIHCEYLKPLLMLGRGMVARCTGGDDARQLLAEGLRASKKMGTREYTWQIQRELALYHRDRGEIRKALDYFQDAIETLRQITETLDEEELKISYLETPLRKRIFDEIRELKRNTQ